MHLHLVHRHEKTHHCRKLSSIDPKSLYRSLAGNHYYATEYEIWADFGPAGNSEKKRWGADYEQLLRAGFSCFQGQKIISQFF